MLRDTDKKLYLIATETGRHFLRKCLNPNAREHVRAAVGTVFSIRIKQLL